MTHEGRTSELHWAAAGRALPGEPRSGDAYLIEEHGRGVLALVVDGLGHGQEACIASERIVAAARERTSAPLPNILEHCHRSSRQTRGATLSLARIDTGARDLSWMGVGDVSGVRVRPGSGGPAKRVHLICAAGVVGYRYGTPRLKSVPFEPGDLLLLATDGIRSGFAEEVIERRDPVELARDTLAGFSRPTDDALVLAVRFCQPSEAPTPSSPA